MERQRWAKGIVWMAATVLVALWAPVGAEAKLPSTGEAPETPPGITVTGLGLAPAREGAVDRAVGDAHRRAAAIAAALHLALGPVEGLELPELTQFGPRAPCQRPRACDRSVPAAAAATVTFGIVGGATGEGPGRWIKANGTASALVKPRDRSLSRSIKRAVLATRRMLAPQAVLSASRNAGSAAEAVGLHLSAIVSVAETPPPFYFGPSFYDAALGSFGPGRFCGLAYRPIVRRDPQTGATRVVRRVRHRRCFVPSPYSVHFSIGYEASQ